jgi:hypothetical protein
MDWNEDPATHQQLRLLQGYGFVPTFPLSVTQAARLIRQYGKHPPGPTPPQAEDPTGPTQHLPPKDIDPSPQTRPERLSETARNHAYQLRLAVLAAARILRESPDRPGVRADLHSLTAARQQFWRDTCRDNREFQTASPHAVEFHEHFGARFFTPTWEEVQEVLDALDGAMPGWDKDHPELFYETLKLNFPSLLRHG